MASADPVESAAAGDSAPWSRTRSIRGWARINIPTAEGMMMASMPRRPKAIR